MRFETILLDKADGIARVTLNLPEKRNPLDLVMREELKDVFLGFQSDPEVRTVVITGAGKAFCAGGDISTMKNVTAPAGRDRLKNIQILVKAMVDLEKPIIAAVNGTAAGAGFHIALACDIIIASQNAKFAESFVKIGLIPDMGGFFLLPSRIGLHRAKELMLTGRMFDAKEAFEMGLLNKIVPPEDLEKEVMELARSFAQGPARAYAMIKSGLNRMPNSLSAMMEIEANMQAICFETVDFKEGMQAFLEKRTPKFTGK